KALVIKPQELVKAVARGQKLLVGAGGIGCELLKSHMLTSFFHFDLIDLDLPTAMLIGCVWLLILLLLRVGLLVTLGK
uniref:THIF-type NAD/FAD binding fold domain-containing protein n=1 Tax=Ailuropoda melanoleuca TaxID=9646 RepID=A0A7N5P4X7_AILME